MSMLVPLPPLLLLPPPLLLLCLTAGEQGCS
jgi:hypothetical protein